MKNEIKCKIETLSEYINIIQEFVLHVFQLKYDLYGFVTSLSMLISAGCMFYLFTTQFKRKIFRMAQLLMLTIQNFDQISESIEHAAFTISPLIESVGMEGTHVDQCKKI